MALGYGDLTFAQIRAEFSGSVSFYDYYRGGSFVPYNSRNGNIPTGPAGNNMAAFRGASYATEGSTSWGSPGYYEWALPPCEWITFTILGAGGGGGGSTYDGGWPGGAGGAGGNSQISFGPYATGGAGGEGSYYSTPGKAGNGSGAGGNVANYYGNGAAGGSGNYYGYTRGGDGGDGGQCVVTYYRGQVYRGQVVGITVGHGGGGGDGSAYGNGGSHGIVYVSWG